MIWKKCCDEAAVLCFVNRYRIVGKPWLISELCDTAASVCIPWIRVMKSREYDSPKWKEGSVQCKPLDGHNPLVQNDMMV